MEDKLRVFYERKSTKLAKKASLDAIMPVGHVYFSDNTDKDCRQQQKLN